jgi:hypothetical protein
MPTHSEDRCMRRTLEPEASSGISRARNSVIRVPSIVERRLGSASPARFSCATKRARYRKYGSAAPAPRSKERSFESPSHINQ